MKQKKAFTLSEVLITLMLVGVIAAITIPLLIETIERQKWAITFKRSFAETYNALTLMAMEENCAKDLVCTHVFDPGEAGASTQAFGEELTASTAAGKPIMSTSRICGTEEGRNTLNCFSHKIADGWGTNSEDGESLAKSLGGVINENNKYFTFVTTRGASYALVGFGNECLTNAANQTTNNDYLDAYVNNYTEADNPMVNLCGLIVIDVNGSQTPNVWGKDVFGVWVTNRGGIGLYPFGGEYDKQYGDKCSATNGRGCAAQMIKDGWTITYL